MIINENNKDNILKGMVKRGFNQDPNELKTKIQNQATPTFIKESNLNKPIMPINGQNLKVNLNKLRNLK